MFLSNNILPKLAMFILLGNEKLGGGAPWAIYANVAHFCMGPYKKNLTPAPSWHFLLNNYSQQPHAAALITTTPTHTLDIPIALL
jgi:hypothetical protein